MILTCPDCATRYFVDDARIGPGGRNVRCASCGTTWRYVAEDGAAPSAMPPPLSLQPAGAGAVLEEADGLSAVRERLSKSADAPKKIRAAAAEKRATQQAVATGVVWAGLGAGFCALALGAVLFRTDVVRLAPATAGAYAFARMPVNPTGLAIEGVQGAPGLKDGHADLTVSGSLRNVEARLRPAAPLRVMLLDKSGKRLASQIVTPTGALKPGETRPFSVSFLDPPLAAASFQVEFAFDAAKKSAAPASPHSAPAPMTLRGMASTASIAPVPAQPTVTAPTGVKDATPLPTNSPYALPAAAPVPLAPAPAQTAKSQPAAKTHG